METFRVEWVDNEGHAFSRVFDLAYEFRDFVRGLHKNEYNYKVSTLRRVK